MSQRVARAERRNLVSYSKLDLQNYKKKNCTECFDGANRSGINSGELVELFLQSGGGVEGSEHFSCQPRHGLVQVLVQVGSLPNKQQPSVTVSAELDKPTV